MVDKLFAAAAAGRAAALGRAPWCRTPAGYTRAGWRPRCSRRMAFPPCGRSFFAPNIGRTGAAWAVAPHGRWLFPGGELASDPELAERLAAGVEGLELDAAAHREEHAIEVQLPLLARLAPAGPRGGHHVGDSPLPELLRFGVAMSVVLREMPQRPLLIDLQRHEPFCRRRSRRAAWIGLALAMPLPRSTRSWFMRLCGATASACAAWRPCVIVDGGAAVVGQPEPMRIGRLCHQCRCQRRHRAAWSATRGCCSGRPCRRGILPRSRITAVFLAAGLKRQDAASTAVAGAQNICGTKRLRLPVIRLSSSRMPMPQAQPLTIQLPIRQ